MLQYERCPKEPHPASFAINHLQDYREAAKAFRLSKELAEQHGTWEADVARARADFNTGRLELIPEIANLIANKCDGLWNAWNKLPLSDTKKDEAAHAGLTALALGKMCAVILAIRPDIEDVDGIGKGWTNTVLEVIPGENNRMLCRLHVEDKLIKDFFGPCPDYTEDEAAWYRTRGLYIRREPSDPDERSIQLNRKRRVESDFSTLDMLTPYVKYTPPLPGDQLPPSTLL